MSDVIDEVLCNVCCYNWVWLYPCRTGALFVVCHNFVIPVLKWWWILLLHFLYVFGVVWLCVCVSQHRTNYCAVTNTSVVWHNLLNRCSAWDNSGWEFLWCVPCVLQMPHMLASLVTDSVCTVSFRGLCVESSSTKLRYNYSQFQWSLFIAVDT